MTVTRGPMHHSWPDMLSRSINSWAGVTSNNSETALGISKSHLKVTHSSARKMVLPTSYSSGNGAGGGNAAVRPRGKQPAKKALMILAMLALGACMLSSLHLLLSQTGGSRPTADHQQPLLRLLGERQKAQLRRTGGSFAAAQQDEAEPSGPQQQQQQQQELPAAVHAAHQQQEAVQLAAHPHPQAPRAATQQQEHKRQEQEQQHLLHKERRGASVWPAEAPSSQAPVQQQVTGGGEPEEQSQQQFVSSAAQGAQVSPRYHQADNVLAVEDSKPHEQPHSSRDQHRHEQQQQQQQQPDTVEDDQQDLAAMQHMPRMSIRPVVSLALTPASMAAADLSSGGDSASAVDPVNSSARDDTTSVYITARGVPPSRLKYPVWWHGPIWSGSGYGSEAINYVLSLLRTGRLAPADIWAYHHGDILRDHVVNALSPVDKSDLEYLQSLPEKYKDAGRPAIVVCHSMSTNWKYPEPMWSAGAECPPNPREFGWLYTIGRTMFETDRLPPMFVPRMNAMNEIWVPSEWQKQSFIASGVAAHKLVVVPEGINTTLYDPQAYTPLQLEDMAQLVLGKSWKDKLSEHQERKGSLGQQQQQQAQQQPSSDHKAGAEAVVEPVVNKQQQQQQQQQQHERQKFTFLSSFKWEHRKGWDILLQAYLSEFTVDDDVELFILTKPYESSGSSFKETMRSWADTLFGSHSAQHNAREAARLSGQLPVFTTVAGGRGPVASGRLAAALGNGPGSTAALTALMPKMHPAPERRRLQQQQQQPLQQRDAGGAAEGQHQHPLLPGQVKCPGGASMDDLMPKSEEQQLLSGLEAINSAHIDYAAKELHQASLSERVSDVAQHIRHSAAEGMPTDSHHPQQQQQQQQGQQAPQQEQQLLWEQQRRLLYRDSVFATATPTAPATGDLLGASAAYTAATSGSSVDSSSPSPVDAIDAVAAAAEADAAKYPTLYVVDQHISDTDFPRFYKAGDAFVLPSRGEGWGRPHVEAMSMGLPVISTNWSGITAYLNESVGYPIAVEKLTQIQGGSEVVWWFRGLNWAQPSVTHLRQLMRHVYNNRAEAAAKGAAARALMINKYSPEAIADILVKEFKRIERMMP